MNSNILIKSLVLLRLSTTFLTWFGIICIRSSHTVY